MAIANKVLLVATATALSASSGTAGAAGRSFVEDFNTLDAQRWTVSNGWTNGDHQGCTWSAHNVAVEDGRTTLLLDDRASRERPFSCAEIQTKDVYGYGTYEVRLRAAPGPGTVTAFFTYNGPGLGLGAPHDEIDFEFLGKDPSSVQLNYYADGKGGHEHFAKLSSDASTTVHDYAFEWLPDKIRWFIDGKLVHEEKPKDGVPFPTHPGRIMISLWNGTSPSTLEWLGQFAYPGKPLAAIYERLSFTAAGEPCQYAASVVCRREAGHHRP